METKDIISAINDFIEWRTQLAQGVQFAAPQAQAQAMYHIPNLKSEDDRTSRIFADIRERYKHCAYLPFYIVLMRTVNNWPVLRDIEFDQPFTKMFIDNYCEYLNYYCTIGTPLSTTSYIQYHYKEQGNKLRLNVFNPLHDGMHHYASIFEQGQPKDVYEHVKTLTSVGSVQAIEITRDILDLRKRRGNTEQPWDMPWVTVSSMRAVNVFMRRSSDTALPKSVYVSDLMAIQHLMQWDEPLYNTARKLHVFGKVTSGACTVLHLPRRALQDPLVTYEEWKNHKEDIAE